MDNALNREKYFQANDIKGFDALIIGGGPAGLSAAITLGRVGRSVLLCDDKRPRNAPSDHINNLPGHDGIHPEVWRDKVRADLKKHSSIQVIEDTVKDVKKDGNFFKAAIGRNVPISVRKILLAYGIEDQLPPISGIKELFGKKIFHCPYCHGFEYREKNLALIANGDYAFHLTVLLKGLSEKVAIFSNGPHGLSEDHLHLMDRNNVQIIEDEIESIEETDGEALNIVFKNGRIIEREAMFIGPIFPLKSKSTIGDQLGCEKTDFGTLKINERGQTTVAGVYAAGDIVTQAHSVQFASASGSMAAGTLNFEFLMDDFKFGRFGK